MLRAVMLLSALCASVFAQSSLVTTEKNGSSTHFKIEWKKGSDVKYDMYDFNVGDTITLTWTEFHDAVVVPDATNPCTTAESARIKTLAEPSMGGSGNYTITASTPDDFWIICTVGSHCSEGNMKIMFMKQGSGSHSATPPSTPAANTTNTTHTTNTTKTPSSGNTAYPLFSSSVLPLLGAAVALLFLA